MFYWENMIFLKLRWIGNSMSRYDVWGNLLKPWNFEQSFRIESQNLIQIEDDFLSVNLTSAVYWILWGFSGNLLFEMHSNLKIRFHPIVGPQRAFRLWFYRKIFFVDDFGHVKLILHYWKLLSNPQTVVMLYDVRIYL